MLRVLGRTFALLLLASIGHDLTAAGCDPLVLSGTTLLTAESAGGGSDPCDDGCVPDCYCCSATLAAVERVRVDTPVTVAHLRATARSIPCSGVGSIPDPVPRPTL